MYLSSVVLLLGGVVTMVWLAQLSLIRGVGPSAGPSSDRATPIAIVLVVTYFVMFAFRSLQFGVDTVYYAGVFGEYCEQGRVDGLELSFTLSAWILNASMLGTCNVNLLPLAWVGLIAAAALLVQGQLSARVQYAALLLFSLVGVELASNALRQGLSITLLVVSISNWRASRAVSIAAGFVALLLHGSAALALGASLLALSPWSVVLSVLAAATLWVSFNLESSIGLPGVSDFLYEIQKYLGHDSDEVWVRVLSFTALVLLLAAARVVEIVVQDGTRERLRAGVEFAEKLTVACIPFLAVPYFGYRFVYAVFPIALWAVARSYAGNPRASTLFFACALGGSFIVLSTWSFGSAYMRAIPFY